MIMLEIYRNMFKEEWRSHSTLFGNVSFGLFPLFIVLISFLFSLASPVFTLIFPEKTLVAIAHYLFFFFGANVGAFGLMGKEFMNRRFGNFSSVAYSSRTLPVSERKIFLNEVLKDITYYFMMWIIPIIAGFALSSVFLKFDLSIIPSLVITLSLSFLVGLAIVFFLSMIYANSGRGFMLFLAFVISLLFFLRGFYLKSISAVFYGFFPLRYFLYGESEYLFYSLVLIAVLIAVSLLIVKVDFPVKTGKYRNSLHSVTAFFERILFGRFSKFVAKDFLDMLRSTGGAGKMIFSFFLPVSFIWVFLGIFTKHVPAANFLIIFSVFLGVFSASFYSWITEYDMFNQYLFFPVKISDILKEKILSYFLLHIVSLLTLLAAALVQGQMEFFAFSLMIFLITSFYALSMTMYLTGLSPSIMFLNVKNVFVYFLMIIPVMLGFIFVYLFSILALVLYSLAILGAAIVVLFGAFRKWDRFTERTF